MIDNRCHIEVSLKNKTGSKNASVGLAYQFLSAGQVIASAGTGAVFTKKNQTITKTIEIPVFDTSIGESCNVYDRIEILDFKAAST